MPEPRPSVALVSPPWGRLDAPSLVCGTLKPFLESRGFSCAVHYLSLELGARLGSEDYLALAEDTHFLSDAVFAAELDGQARDYARLAQVVAGRLGDKKPGALARRLAAAARRAQKAARRLLSDQALAPLARADFAVFACERDVHNQTIPAAAVARRLKELNPATRVVLTGLGVEGPVAAAFLEAFPWLDLVVQGDPEAALPGALRALRDGGELPDGCAARAGDCDRYAVLDGLDELPAPDFDDYFSALEALRPRGLFVPEPTLPFEGSRGCWWGARSHCRFCNLNDATIAPRRKSAQRLAEELGAQSRRHRVFRFHGRDNNMPREYLEELVPLLRGLDLRLFFEMKPFLGPDAVEALAQAGVREVQPGLETFSTRLLRESGKGTTAAQNVAFMKWARGAGVELRWYMLRGFPGERREDYELLLRLLPRLRHLQPPLRLRKLELVRNSPYFDAYERHGFADVRPFAEYQHVFPSGRLDWSRAAHWFDHRFEGEDALAGLAARLEREVELWKAAWSGGRRPTLELRRGAGFCEIRDERAPGGRVESFSLEGDAAWALAACGREALSAEELARRAAAEGRGADAAFYARLLRELDERGLVWLEEGRALSLALPYRRGAREFDILGIYRPHLGEKRS